MITSENEEEANHGGGTRESCLVRNHIPASFGIQLYNTQQEILGGDGGLG